MPNLCVHCSLVEFSAANEAPRLPFQSMGGERHLRKGFSVASKLSRESPKLAGSEMLSKAAAAHRAQIL